MQRTIDDVVETLNEAKHNQRRCSVLVGAGCSATAGIPLATRFVSIIKERFPGAYIRAAEKTYPYCMAELRPGQRHDLIAEYVDKAKINWAHLALAQLLINGYVDRVLTTNFDPLVARACAILGIFPAIYDFAASQTFKPAAIPDQAVFYLHGQRSGFVLLHTTREVERLSEDLTPVFEDAGRGRVWLVVGYSGDNDPVFLKLAEVPSFEFPLFWVGYRNEAPGRHVVDRLLVDDKGAFLVEGFDSDTFFVQVAQKLGCFPPELLKRPFTHLCRQLESFTPFAIQPGLGEIDVTEVARLTLQRAIEQFESPGAPERRTVEGTMALAQSFLLAGQYERVLEIATAAGPEEMLAEPTYWAHLKLGNQFRDQAVKLATNLAQPMFVRAYACYQSAFQRMPQRHEALSAWGTALLDQARLNRDDPVEVDRLHGLAATKFEEACRIKPTDDQGLTNWGTVLLDRARTKSGPEAERLFEQAAEKYRAAIAVKPDLHEARNSLGLVSLQRAINREGTDADRLYELAAKQFEAAVTLMPNNHEALYNWGTALLNQARTKTSMEADRLYASAGEKFAAVVDIKPDRSDALNNWGVALLQRSQLSSGIRAVEFARLAIEKHKTVLRITPRRPEVLVNLAASLMRMAALSSTDEAAAMSSDAEDKLRQAEGILPGSGAYSLACLHALRGEATACLEWLTNCQALGKLPSRKLLLTDPDLARIRGCDWYSRFVVEGL